MNDKKRLNAENAKPIKKGDIDAWNRGKDDAKRNKMLMKNLSGVSSSMAVNVVKLFADSGDEQFIRNKLSISVSDIRNILNSFGIKSIEDARKVVKSGLVHELDVASATNRQEAEVAQRAIENTQSDKLKAHDKEFAKKPALTDEEKDLKLRDARNDAFAKNKAEKIKSLIAEGIKPVKTNGFQISMKDVSTFKSMIPHGVSQLQRRFGGTPKDIVREIKRLSPTTDTDMLRP